MERENRRGEFDEESGQSDCAERRKVLCEEQVGGRVVTLLEERGSEIRGSRIANGHGNACLVADPVDEWLDEILAAARIGDETVARVSSSTRL